MSTATATKRQPKATAEEMMADAENASYLDIGSRLYHAGRGPQEHAHGKPDWPHDWHYLREELLDESGVHEEVAALVQEAKARAETAWRQTDAYQAGLALEQGITETAQALADAEQQAARREADYRAAMTASDDQAALAALEQARKSRDQMTFRTDQLANRRAKLAELEREQLALLRQLHKQEREKLLEQVQPRVQKALVALGKALSELLPLVALDGLVASAYSIWSESR